MTQTSRDQFGNQHTIRCSGCGVVCRDLVGWNSTRQGRAVAGFVCSTCLTWNETAEAEPSPRRH